MHLKWYDQNAFIEIVKNDANLSSENFLPCSIWKQLYEGHERIACFASNRKNIQLFITLLN